ncbi:MAG: glycosyltransferase family 39 protein [Anaerolineales bacterium]|nr:glycosyltransferase family 39 protein [Anaerolineales bacterium]
MSRRVQAVILMGILLVGAWLRFTGLDWDAYNHHHPDERYITWVATTIEWPADWQTALDPRQSPLNPYYWPPDAASVGIEVPQDQPRDYAYGHLPLYLGVAATRLAERLGPPLAARLPADWLLTRDLLNGRNAVEFRHLTAVSRALTGLVDLGTVLVLFWLGRRLFGPAVGLLAAAFLALNVMHVQLAHFFTSDPYLTFFVVTAVALMARGVQPDGARRRPGSLLLAAVFVGLAVGSKFSAVLLFVPLGLAFWLWRGKSWQAWVGTAVLLAGLAFFVTNPFAVLDLSCTVVTPETRLGPLTIPRLNWRSCYLENVVTQGAMVRGRIDLPFTRQYIGTRPYLYPVAMQLQWGMGPLLGVAAFAGFGWAAWRLRRGLDWRRWRAWGAQLDVTQRPLLITLAWSVPFFLTTAGFYVKFMRYLQPLAPFLMLYAAALLWAAPWPRLRWGATAVVVAGTALYAAAFAGLYAAPHPWNAASAWIYANVPRGSLILSEQWDDPLPTTLQVGDVVRRAGEYRHAELSWLTGQWVEDDAAKLRENVALLAAADYVVLSSPRVYAVVTRLPERYPLTSQVHQRLFDGALGYELVGVYGRFPTLGPFSLKPDAFGWLPLRPPAGAQAYLDGVPGITLGRADESFVVYDQPLTLIFENRERLPAEAMLAELAATN